MSTTIDTTRIEEFVGQVLVDAAAAASAPLVHIGDRLGLYRAMADGQPVTARELADRTQTHPRYIAEWLANQAAGGYVELVAGADGEDAFRLPPEHAAVLADPDSPVDLAGTFEVLASIARSVDRLTDAFRSGEGVGWGEHHCGLWHGVERVFGAVYRGNLVAEWIPALDGVEERLRAGAVVADVGCGHGISTILLAGAYPRSSFVGYDLHAESIATARGRAREAGDPDNVRFEVSDAAAIPHVGYDLVTTFDALHDMGDPAAAARRAREILADDGTWMIVEPLAGDSVAENLNPVGRYFYAASTAVCTPGSLAQPGGAALGAQAGPARLERIVREAGFTRFRVAHRTPFNMVLEARP